MGIAPEKVQGNLLAELLDYIVFRKGSPPSGTAGTLQGLSQERRVLMEDVKAPSLRRTTARDG